MSSVAPGKSNWTELTLYRTIGGSFVVQTIARTTRSSQRDWFSARAHDDAADVIDGMKGKLDRRNPKARRVLSGFAFALLERAAETEQDIADALDNIEGQEEHIK